MSSPTTRAASLRFDRGADAVAFSSVYEAHFREVARWVRALGGPHADVEDLAQEVFLVVRRKLPSFDGRNLSAWLYAITRRVVSDHRRRAWFVRLWKGRRDDDLDEAPVAESEPAASDPARELERKRERELLERLLAQLPAARRETFVLFEVLGYSGDEIARLQDVAVNTVWTRLHQARKEFVALVAEHEASTPTVARRGHVR